MLFSGSNWEQYSKVHQKLHSGNDSEPDWNNIFCARSLKVDKNSSDKPNVNWYKPIFGDLVINPKISLI